MVLIHDKDRVYEHNDSRKNECHYCHKRLSHKDEKGEIVFDDYFELKLPEHSDSCIVCVQCFHEKTGTVKKRKK